MITLPMYEAEATSPTNQMARRKLKCSIPKISFCNPPAVVVVLLIVVVVVGVVVVVVVVELKKAQ